MGCINANGERLPPMFIFSGVRRKMEWLDAAPFGSVCAVTESSNINADLFLLHILDGHFSHTSVAAVKYGHDRDVHLFVLPAHTSHFLQPLDVGVFQPFKALYEKEIQRYPLDNNGALPIKDNVAGLTNQPFKMAFSERNVKRGFRNTGIYPPVIGNDASNDFWQQPTTNTISFRHHEILVPHFDGKNVSERTQAALKRRRINLDTSNVVNLSLKMLISPPTQPRPKGHFVNEKVSGGKLLSYQDMLDEKRRKEDARLAKDGAKRVRQDAVRARAAAALSRPSERSERSNMALHDKGQHQTAAVLRKLAPQRRLIDQKQMMLEDFNVFLI